MDDELRIINIIFQNRHPVNIQQLLQYLWGQQQQWDKRSKEYRKLYMRLYRKLLKMRDDGLVVLVKDAYGVVFVSLTPRALNLIQQARNSNSRKSPIQSLFQLPKKARPERIEAIKKVLTVQMLSPQIKEQIDALFDEYISDVSNRIVVLKRREDADPYMPPFILYPYRTRFTSNEIAVENLKKYETVFKIASQHYKYAVFLTLTTDPNRFKSLWHSWRHFSVAWNRFMSYIRKRLGFRPHYVAVYEFTKSGLLHTHVVLFGIKHLLHYKEISRVWSKHGQGRIIYIYQIRNDNGKWHWVRKRPKDAKKGEGAEDYLKKYLKKALFQDEGLSLYWVSNKRFFTCSRFFSQYFPKRPSSLGEYEFFGSFLEWDLPEWVLTPESYISPAIYKQFIGFTPPPS